MPGGEPPDRLRLEYRVDDGVAIVDADGEIDVFTCGPLRDRLLALVDEGHSGLVGNLGRAAFIHSAGPAGRGPAGPRPPTGPLWVTLHEPPPPAQVGAEQQPASLPA